MKEPKITKAFTCAENDGSPYPATASERGLIKDRSVVLIWTDEFAELLAVAKRAPKLGENIISDPELNELRRAQETAAAVCAVFECAIYEVVQAAKSAKEAARIGTDARIAIGRLRADVQHAVNAGEAMTVEALLARLDGIVEGRS